MSKNLSRRDFNKLVAAGAAIGIVGGAGTAVSAAEKSASSSSVALRWLPNNEAVLRRWHEIIREAIGKKEGNP